MGSPDGTLSNDTNPHDTSQKLWEEDKTCVVVNFSDEELEVEVGHLLSPNGKRDKGHWSSLKPGDSVSFDITCKSLNLDYWHIWIYRQRSKDSWERDNRVCDVDYDDVDSVAPVYVLLFKIDDGWSIQMPSSTSCLGYRYERS